MRGRGTTLHSCLVNLVSPVEDVVGAARGLVAVVPRPALTAGAGPLTAPSTTPVPAVPWLQYKL